MYPVIPATPCTQRKNGQGKRNERREITERGGRGKEINRETGREEGRKKEIQ